MTKYIFIFLISILLVSCHSPQPTLTPQQALDKKVSVYIASAQKKLHPYFEKAKVPYPPHNVALLVFKDTKQLELWAKADKNGRWTFIHTFPVLGASGGPGPKLKEGDRQVPEGVYRIVGLNPFSHYDLSMHVNYPNDFDLKEAKQDGRDQLGGNIYIHGNKLSAGCIAIGDSGIEQIFPLVYQVGARNSEIVIAPNDLRSEPPLEKEGEPKWVSGLYKNIADALNDFRT